jgi:hypothetical protein
MVELEASDLARLTPEQRATIVGVVIAAGYEEAEISPEPFRSGSLNASFTKRLAVAS